MPKVSCTIVALMKFGQKSTFFFLLDVLVFLIFKRII